MEMSPSSVSGQVDVKLSPSRYKQNVFNDFQLSFDRIMLLLWRYRNPDFHHP